jgi:hypothetical protein
MFGLCSPSLTTGLGRETAFNRASLRLVSGNVSPVLDHNYRVLTGRLLGAAAEKIDLQSSRRTIEKSICFTQNLFKCFNKIGKIYQVLKSI